MVVSSIAPAVPDPIRSPRPILAYDRRTGRPVAFVPSCSQPNAYHAVTMDGKCSCKGFTYRGRCRHTAQPEPNPLADGGTAHLQVLKAAGEWPATSAKVQANAKLYAEIFGRDE